MKFALIVSLLACLACSAADKLDEKIVDKLANAIYKLENSESWPYGIRSIEIKGKTKQEREMYARQVAKTTIRNNYLRWQKSGKEGAYLDYLADKFCPKLSDRQGNTNWKKNIRKISGLDF